MVQSKSVVVVAVAASGHFGGRLIKFVPVEMIFFVFFVLISIIKVLSQTRQQAR